jgi:hypothetical protein
VAKPDFVSVCHTYALGGALRAVFRGAQRGCLQHFRMRVIRVVLAVVCAGTMGWGNLQLILR